MISRILLRPATLVVLLCAVPNATLALPHGFVEETVASDFEQPVAVAFDPGGRLFVAEKAGRVWLVQDDRRVAFLDLTGEVNAVGDRGLTGIAVDPDFAVNRWVYLLYTVDTEPGEPDESRTAVFGRVTRYTADGDSADPDSRTVLLGRDAADGIASCYGGHATGALRFAPDGALLVSAGDGANLDFVDVGQDLNSLDPDCARRFGDDQDVGAFRAQSLASLSGKILRIDPRTGLGLPDNPHFDGDAESPASRIFCRGFRNPFRFSVEPATGDVWIGDVGVAAYEELDLARGGENFGWPCHEGPEQQPAYQADSIAAALCDGVTGVTPPVLAWRHDLPGSVGFTGAAVTGVACYAGTAYPEVFRGSVFVADLVGGWIRAVSVADGAVTGVREFSEDVSLPVDLVVDPVTESLVYVSVGHGDVRRIRYTLANQAPFVRAQAVPAGGAPPLQVQFTSDGTYDPDGDPLRVVWSFGDGSPRDTRPNPRHVYTEAGTFTAWLRAWDDSGHVDSASVTVRTDGPPRVEILAPGDGDRFVPDDPLRLEAEAVSPRGLELTYDWRVDLIHNSHPHPAWFRSTEAAPLFVPEAHGGGGDRYFYEIHLAVTDTEGAPAADTARIFPAGEVRNHEPVARMLLDRFAAEPGSVVRFDGGVSVDPDEDRLDHAWDFGDGFTATGARTSHFYAEPGLYRARLTVRDPAGATSEAEAMIAVEPAGALVRYDFEESGGELAEDGATGRRPARIVGAARVPGAFRGALEFDGRDDMVEGPPGLLSGLDAFTLAAWVRVDDRELGSGFVGQHGAVALGLMNSRFLRVETAGGGMLTVYFGAGDRVWHHVAATGDGAELSLHVDGIRVASLWREAPGGYGASDEPLRLGGGRILNEHRRSLRGRLDGVRVYPRALSRSEIALLARRPPSNAPPWVSAGGDTIAGTSEPVGLRGRAGDDGLPAPGQLRFTWAQVDGPGEAGFSRPHDLYTLALFSEPGPYRLALTAEDGEHAASDTLSVVVGGRRTGIGDRASAGPRVLALGPNPARGPTAVTYAVEAATPAALTVFDLGGRVVASRDLGVVAPGVHEARWDGSTTHGTPAASGIYFLELRLGDVRHVRKLTRLH